MLREDFIRELLGRMTVEQKTGQLNLLTGTMDATGMKDSGDLSGKIASGACGAVLNVYTPSATRSLQELAASSPLGIPLLFGYDVIHGHRTIFPIPLALSCSWNPDLLEKCARVSAAEASADGLHWVFSPMVDISLDARWGRVAEGSGEDPWLGSRIARAMVRGYQGKDPTAITSVIACVKHFALYGAPMGGRDYNGVDMSRRAMEETYFPPYRAAVDVGARTVMTSFNDIDGVPASGNRWLLTDLLRAAWNFQGMIVTDYTTIMEMKFHGTSATDAEAAKQALHAGVDMDMVSEAYLKEIPSLIASGEIPIEELDAAVTRVLETKWDLGLFEDPFSRCDEARARAIHLCEQHRSLALEAARESIVLLKNENGLLPLSKIGTVAVIGPLADSARDMLGCWIAAGNAKDAVSPLQGIQDSTEGCRISYAKGCETESNGEGLLAEAVSVAEGADQVILILGENWMMNGEAASRTDIRLPKCQRKLAKRILKTGKPCVLVTMSGRPLDLSAEDAKFATILHAWALGTEGGHALAEVIFGDVAPIGKLTMGFPRSVGQLPMTYREKPTGRPFAADVQYTSKYLDCRNDALFPFGHGLTYGAVKLGDLEMEDREMAAGGSVTVSILISNSCDRSVTETLQLYLRDPVASVTRPVKELRGYERITLDVGESRRVSFTITDADLAFPGADFLPVVEAGEFIAMVGLDSVDVRSRSFRRL